MWVQTESKVKMERKQRKFRPKLKNKKMIISITKYLTITIIMQINY